MREEEEIGFEIGEHSVLRARLFLMGIIKVSGSNTDGVPVSDQLYISFYFKEQMKRYINQKVRILWLKVFCLLFHFLLLFIVTFNFK